MFIQIVSILLPFGLIYRNTFQKCLKKDVTLTKINILPISNKSTSSTDEVDVVNVLSF